MQPVSQARVRELRAAWEAAESAFHESTQPLSAMQHEAQKLTQVGQEPGGIGLDQAASLATCIVDGLRALQQERSPSAGLDDAVNGLANILEKSPPPSDFDAAGRAVFSAVDQVIDASPEVDRMYAAQRAFEEAVANGIAAG